jgi:hypothetical protein
MLKNNLQILCQKIISGGQTGVDRGTLDACLELNFPCGGWCPAGRRAEDGIIPAKYPLKQTREADYATRTKRNIQDSDATLIIHHGPLSGGTKLTYEYIQVVKKSVMLVVPGISTDVVLEWLGLNKSLILNVAGPRESEWPGAEKHAYTLISKLINDIKKNNLTTL